MPTSKKYLVDANILMSANRSHYAFGICSGFWEIIKSKHDSEQVFSIGRVKQEIDRGNDDLKEWVSGLPRSFFCNESEPAVLAAFVEMMAWVMASEQYDDNAKAQFADDADGWLIAYAKAHDCVVVTHEAHNPFVKKRVPMPNVCEQFEVEYMNCFEMLDELGTDLIAS